MCPPPSCFGIPPYADHPLSLSTCIAGLVGVKIACLVEWGGGVGQWSESGISIEEELAQCWQSSQDPGLVKFSNRDKSAEAEAKGK